MELTDFEVLDYLHDATVTSLVYRFDVDNRRELVLTVICNRDAGYPTWDGKRIVIRLHDLILANHFVVGAMAGREHLDAWRAQLSPSMAVELKRLAAAGIRPSGHPFVVAFHSGSALDVICRRVFVEVHEAA